MLAEKLNSGAGGPVNYIEDVFSTYLYNGNGSTQTITNGIDLAGKGGLVWIKNRISTFGNHLLSDSARGLGTTVYKTLSSNLTDAQNTTTNDGVSAFNANGFSVTGSSAAANDSGSTYASWTFRKQPKFFDVVTYTGTGSVQNIAHSLGSTPGCIIIKCISSALNWTVYHRGLSNPLTRHIQLNTTAAELTSSIIWDSTAPTSTQFTVGNFNNVNRSGDTYVAYLFAHDAGGFGLTGTDNVISCGSYTGNGSATGPVVTLGYEPQWVLVKSASGTTANWFLCDTMRGFPTATGSETRYPLIPNSTDAEATYASSAGLYPTSTGFSINTSAANFNQSGASYIYIAIRRGPMKVPTDGTSVFAMDTSKSTGPAFVSGFPVDMEFYRDKASVGDWYLSPRLTSQKYLITNKTNAEASGPVLTFDFSNGWGAAGAFSTSTNNVSWMFRRAPSFFDVVCYTGTGSARTVNHNLGVAPELMIVKQRSAIRDWSVYSAAIGATNALYLNTTAASAAASIWNSTAPTASVFSLAGLDSVNASGGTFVAYLFASCPGVSKVGSYTGTGTTQQINCGFTGGARFVLIKRTDSTGDWYVWDTARGIVAGNDPYLLLNSTAAETTTTDYIDPVSSGFEISSTAPAAINASGGTFIYLAIA